MTAISWALPKHRKQLEQEKSALHTCTERVHHHVVQLGDRCTSQYEACSDMWIADWAVCDSVLAGLGVAAGSSTMHDDGSDSLQGICQLQGEVLNDGGPWRVRGTTFVCDGGTT